MISEFTIDGFVEFEFVKPDGSTILSRSNLIVNTGLNLLARAIGVFFGSGEAAIGTFQCAVGTGVAPPDENDIALGAECFSNTVISTTRENNVVIIRGSYFLGECNPLDVLGEAGLFFDETGVGGPRTMICRALIVPPRAKCVNEVLNIRWSWRIKRKSD